MKSWGSAIFPLSVLLALAALTFWLRHAIELPEERRDGKTRHDPDYIIEQPQWRKLNSSGQLQYTMTAGEIRHFPDNDTTEVTRPRIEHLHPTRPPIVVTAERARVDKTGDRVDFLDKVRIQRQATTSQAELVATTPDLTVFPDAEKAFTKSPVLITEGASSLRGVGMQLNQKTQTYILESQALGQFESRHARKR